MKTTSFNSRVLRLILVTVIPSFIFLGTLSVILARQKVESSQDNLEMTATAMSAAIDQRISSVISALEIILVTEGRELQSLNLKKLHARLRKAVAGQPDWISMAYLTLEGDQHFNTLKEYGEPAPNLKGQEFFHRALSLDKVSVSGLRIGLIIKAPLITIVIPVKRNQKMVGYLLGSLKPESLTSILTEQGLREGWTAALIDSNGLIIARSRSAQDYVGKSVTPILKKRVLNSEQGLFEDENLEGSPSMGYLKTSSLTGWSIAVGMPSGESTSAFFNTLWIVFFAGIIFMALSIFLAYEFSRGITAPIAALARAAKKLGNGEDIQVPDSSIKEIQEVGLALMEAADSSRKAIDLRDTFLSVASHELKTPLSALSLNLTLIEREMGDNPSAKLQQRIARGKNQVKRLNDLIEELLDVSRISSGKLSLKRENVSLDHLAKEVLSQFEDLKIDVQLEAAEIFADGGRIEQVILNLLTNAYRYGEGKSIALKVWKDGNFACLSVRDEGAGISKNDQERIFQKFDQAHQRSSSKGLGLGLWISRQIAEAHEGTLSVESELGKGSIFTLRLPTSRSN